MSCNREDVFGFLVMPDGSPCPELMTEGELVTFLRIPQVSSATDFHNTVENLKRIHDLPRIYICGKALYPVKAIQDWIAKNTTT